MKRIYANYCMLETVYVQDDATDEEILEAIKAAYAERGVDFESFDDGEWEVTK